MTFSISHSGTVRGKRLLLEDVERRAGDRRRMPARRRAPSPPRSLPVPTFTNRAVVFMAANAAASNMWRVCGVNGMVSIT